jgi:hypothetical protein
MAKRKPVLPPMRDKAASPVVGSRRATATKRRTSSKASGSRAAATPATNRAAVDPGSSRTRKAQLRLVHVDPWSVMKTAFLLSIAVGIISVVAVGIIWGVLGAAGVWDSINSTVQQTVGSDTGTPFDITHYVGTGRVLGFTMLAAVIDVILITAIATLGAFVYNLASTLIGGVEVTFAEER